ncbi:hypothetical protein L6164_031135 [Bauhinia variegata]|uniref:Uncharacterized protein n=1 Tax=Bauhinia variegata TaxID=167791 RepID=A0ACB9LFD8_BAUVA|nr:hypothetical protein L6164_031135 [Bauhinia variegata]
MESPGTGAFMRNRRLESLLDTSSGQRIGETPKMSGKEEPERKPRTDVFADDDGQFPTRIRHGNIYGHVTGKMLMWILGNPIKIEGAEYNNEKAIYISNHASPIDIFLIMWLTPTGTVGIAKKEIIWYPLFGQLYVLANHLRIDRSNPTAAIESMKEAARAILENSLSLIIFPEGTRSRNGRLLPFKKGFVHLAIQTRLPIVPMVLVGTHKAWRKGSLHVRPAPLTIKYLPPISTENWKVDKIDDYVKMLHDIYAENLPESQRPLP